MKKGLGLLLSLSIITSVCSCSSDFEREQKEILISANPNELSIKEAQQLVLDFVNMDPQTKHGISLDFSGCKTHYCQVQNSSSLTKSGKNANEVIPVYELLLKKDDKNGFALVVGDKRIQQVLAYTEFGTLNDTIFNLGLKSFMNSIPAHLDSKLENYMAFSVGQNLNVGTKAGDPTKDMYTHYINMNVAWGQNSPYNNLVPYACPNMDSSYGGKAPVGCAPVALAQLMSYYKKPATYNWNLLLTSSKITQADTDARKNEIATLMHNLGTDLSTRYGCEGSGTDVNMKLVVLKNYGYTVCTVDPFRGVLAEIKANRPLLIHGECNKGGHLWIIDGCRYYTTLNPLGQYEQFHYYSMNWGWNGSSNGDYLVFDVLYGDGGGPMKPVKPAGKPSDYEFNNNIIVYAVSN